MDEKGNACIGIVIGFVLIFGWLFLLIASIVFITRGINLQTELNRPQRYYLHRTPIQHADLELSAAIPSKVVPGSPTSVILWASPAAAGITTTQVITISFHTPPPLFVKRSGVITLTVNPVEAMSWRQIDYDSIDLESEDRTVQFRFFVRTGPKAPLQPVTAETLLDTDRFRRQISSFADFTIA